MKPTTTKCLRPDCTSPAKHRGLCGSCYSCACRLVKQNKTSWDVLTSTGKALPAKSVADNASRHVQEWFLTPVQQQQIPSTR